MDDKIIQNVLNPKKLETQKLGNVDPRVSNTKVKIVPSDYTLIDLRGKKQSKDVI